jgi:hypothetical protein
MIWIIALLIVSVGGSRAIDLSMSLLVGVAGFLFAEFVGFFLPKGDKVEEIPLVRFLGYETPVFVVRSRNSRQVEDYFYWQTDDEQEECHEGRAKGDIVTIHEGCAAGSGMLRIYRRTFFSGFMWFFGVTWINRRYVFYVPDDSVRDKDEKKE